MPVSWQHRVDWLLKIMISNYLYIILMKKRIPYAVNRRKYNSTCSLNVPLSFLLSRMMATNYMGAFCLTKILLPLLENSPVPSRVVNVTSFTHRNGNFRYLLFYIVLQIYGLIIYFFPLFSLLVLFAVFGIEIDKETISGIRFSGLKYYPFAHIYECSKCKVSLWSKCK